MLSSSGRKCTTMKALNFKVILCCLVAGLALSLAYVLAV
jgi:hypothetical protein